MHVTKYLGYELMYKRSFSSKILEIGMILDKKIERKAYGNENNFVSYFVYITTD